jgi:uncharacterized protein (DUF1778 family)
MTLKLKISSETEAKLRERAAASGQDVESFVLQAVTEKLADADLTRKLTSENGNDWEAKLRACIDLHPVVTHLVDDSRESIYAGRGE